MHLRAHFSALTGLILTLSATPALAGEAIEISGLHLCCGGCVAAVEEALSGVEGISDIEVDQKSRTATFSADDEKAVTAAGAALLNAGFFGEQKRGDKTAPLTISDTAKIDAGTKVDRAVFDNVHLCCKLCSVSVTKSLKDVKEVIAVDCDTKAHTVTLTGKDFDVAAALEALHSAGFHGTLRRDSSDNTARAKNGKAR